MQQTAKHSAQTNRQDWPVPGRIAALPRFPTLAVGFGTHDLRRILAHVQRGLLRAMMLERYLLARAAQGRDIEPTPIPGSAGPDAIAALNLKCRPQTERDAKPRKPATRSVADSDDPLHFAIPSLEELEAQVRRRSIGRTVAEICMDLGISPAVCDGAFWFEISEVLRQFDGDFTHFHEVQTHRREAFQQERDKRPETWTWPLWERANDAMREMLGFFLGEPNATAPSG